MIENFFSVISLSVLFLPNRNMRDRIIENLSVHSRGVVKIGGVTVEEGGLWRECAYVGTTFCLNRPLTCSGVPSSLLDVCIKLITARIFVTLACILSAFGVLFLLTVGIAQTSNATFVLLGKAFAGLSFICGVIGVPVGLSWALYVGRVQLGAAAILGIIATILSLVSTGIAIFIPRNQI
jgi:hypothetical protein